MVKISAFPKCWLEDICEGRMSLWDWMETATQLHCDGLEMYSGFLESHDPAYLDRVRDWAHARGMELPMMCCSPDFTVPDDALRAREVEKQKDI